MNSSIVFVGIIILGIVITGVFFAPKLCGIETCHGLDVTCGPDIRRACTEIVIIGDGCHQFVECRISGLVCAQAPSPKFDFCKTCVQDCIDQDPLTKPGYPGGGSCERACITAAKNL